MLRRQRSDYFAAERKIGPRPFRVIEKVEVMQLVQVVQLHKLHDLHNRCSPEGHEVTVLVTRHQQLAVRNKAERSARASR
jgi:hypothetical protein